VRQEIGHVSSHLPHTAVLGCTIAVAFHVSFVLVRKVFLLRCSMLDNSCSAELSQDQSWQRQTASATRSPCFLLYGWRLCLVAPIQCQRYNAISMSYTSARQSTASPMVPPLCTALCHQPGTYRKRGAGRKGWSYAAMVTHRARRPFRGHRTPHGGRVRFVSNSR